MLPAHGYSKLKEFKHLVGNYGGVHIGENGGKKDLMQKINKVKELCGFTEIKKEKKITVSFRYMRECTFFRL